ncbi:MAG: thioredoxin domain-containing protein [Candidatus Altiarchaeota archaeon]
MSDSVRESVITVILAALLTFTGCVSQGDVGFESETGGVSKPTWGDQDFTSSSQKTWMDYRIRDISTGRVFRISDLDGEIVLVESFAVWCPTCKRQQDEIHNLVGEYGGRVASVGLDTDPNEDAEKLSEYVERNNYGGLYAISPPELTQRLIDEYGLSVLNAPGAPVIMVCRGKGVSTRILDRGLKTVDKLRVEVEKGC